MPIYVFKNTETEEVFEKYMSLSSREEYLKENPHIITQITAPAPMMDPVALGVRKPDQGFKEVLQRVHNLTPGSQLNKTTNI